MLTFIMSALCALSINASTVASQADTLDRYIINGQKVEKFDGSQLVGKNVSDYKVVVADGEVEGNVFRMHLIRTDGQKVKEVRSAKAVGATPDGYVIIINGKKSSISDLNNVKTESIASMTVYKRGSKEAVEISGNKDVAVIKVETKK